MLQEHSRPLSDTSQTNINALIDFKPGGMKTRGPHTQRLQFYGVLCEIEKEKLSARWLSLEAGFIISIYLVAAVNRDVFNHLPLLVTPLLSFSPLSDL